MRDKLLGKLDVVNLRVLELVLHLEVALALGIREAIEVGKDEVVGIENLGETRPAAHVCGASAEAMASQHEPARLFGHLKKIGSLPPVHDKSLHSQPLQERHDCRPLGFTHFSEELPGCLRLATMPEDCFFQGTGAAIVEIRLAATDSRRQSDPPKWGRAPVAPRGGSFA